MGAQQVHEKRDGIELAQVRGAEHGGEHQLRDGAARGAIAAAGHLAGHDGRPQGVFDTPVRRIERGLEKEREDRGDAWKDRPIGPRIVSAIRRRNVSTLKRNSSH